MYESTSLSADFPKGILRIIFWETSGVCSLNFLGPLIPGTRLNFDTIYGGILFFVLVHYARTYILGKTWKI